MNELVETVPVGVAESLSSIEDKMSTLMMDKPYKIRLPSALGTRGALGVEVAILQMIGTWIRFNKHKKIFHSHQKGSAEQFQKLCSSIYGIGMLSLVDEVWDSSGEKLERRMALSSAQKDVEALKSGDFYKVFKSRYFGIPYIKKPAYDREYEMPFYNDSKVITSDAFFRIFEHILEAKIAGRTRLESLKRSIDTQDLSDIIWEIFKNTHDHGRVHVNGDEISKNFRSIIIQQQDIDDKYLDNWLGKTPTPTQLRFANYWKSRPHRKYPILDISVVDFGDGFVKLASAKAKSADSKIVILKCLEAGWSRLSGASRGYGLTKVVNAVHKHGGWLRIRTGKYLVEKTFDEGESASLALEDIKEMPVEVAGTSFHISFFLEGFQKRGGA